MKLRNIAYTRAGDKGNMVNISVISYRESDYALSKSSYQLKGYNIFFMICVKGLSHVMKLMDCLH